jgi:organic radical activating enzyme
VEASSISCGDVMTYYANDYADAQRQSYYCHVCLQNSSCSFCSGADEMSCFLSASGGGASCPGRDLFISSCCPNNCHGRGSCSANSEYNDFTCHCDLLYSGSSCQNLSLFAYLLIAFSVLLLVTGSVSLLYYYYYRKQPKQMLEELLNQIQSGGGGDDTITGREIVSQSNLLRLQQEFILKDVFVKSEEIKVDRQIGEGSFGVVYKVRYLLYFIILFIPHVLRPLFFSCEGDL